MSQSQTQRGKAFEYAVASAFRRALNVPLDELSAINAKTHYDACPDSPSMDIAAAEAAMFLKAFDESLDDATLIQLQPGTAGQRGDVRDILIRLNDGEVGISAKTQSNEIRAPRLSKNIDFGKEWADYPVSSGYWEAVNPIFEQLDAIRAENPRAKFSDIPNKVEAIYLPVLTAFEDELRRLCSQYGPRFIERMFRYIIGRYDFYKVVRRRDHVLVQPFNLNGTLGWGRRWSIPRDIELIRRPTGSRNKILVSFEGGAQVSFRIHNASSKIEPSLKFSITFVGLPHDATGNQIPISSA